MRGDPLAYRAERVDRGLLQGVIQPAVQLPGDRPGHPGIAAGSGEQRAGAEPEQARWLHRLHPDAGRAAHQHRDAQHVAGPGVPDRDLPASSDARNTRSRPWTTRAARGSDPGW